MSRFGRKTIICADGYENDDEDDCKKIDFCKSNPCSQEANCTSLETNFTCNCKTGFNYNYVTQVCDDVPKCPIVTCPVNSVCNELPGTYECQCKSGFEDKNNNVQNPNCQNKDECELGLFNCASDRICVDTIGDYDCVCKQGTIEHNDECLIGGKKIIFF